MTAVLMVFVGGAVGAPARYLIDRAVTGRHDGVFPWGTLLVNVLGALLLGFVVGAAGHLGPDGVALLGTGLCGGLTTFSTFGYETARLLEAGAVLEAGLNAAGSLLAGIAAATGGYALAAVLL